MHSARMKATRLVHLPAGVEADHLLAAALTCNGNGNHVTCTVNNDGDLLHVVGQPVAAQPVKDGHLAVVLSKNLRGPCRMAYVKEDGGGDAYDRADAAAVELLEQRRLEVAAADGAVKRAKEQVRLLDRVCVCRRGWWRRTYVVLHGDAVVVGRGAEDVGGRGSCGGRR
jgi:hypothetical protein